MSETYQILREDPTVDAFIEFFTKSKLNIKDIFCAIRFRDGTLEIIDNQVPFETLCTISKRLDLIIDEAFLGSKLSVEEVDEDLNIDEEE